MTDPVRLYSPNPSAPTAYGAPDTPGFQDPRHKTIVDMIVDTPGAAWGSLPPQARSNALSLIELIMDLSPGAAVRDTMDASGRIIDSARQGDVWGSLGAGANMLTAMAGLVPGGRAAGKAAAKVADLPMDEVARLARADSLGFRIPVYHGTSAPDFSAFSPTTTLAGRSSGQRTVGVWAAEDPQVANYFASLQTGTPRVLPLLGRSEKRGKISLTGDEQYLDTMATIAHAFDNGYDAIRLLNHDVVPALVPQTTWVFRDPSQLRSRFAKFDPTKTSSSDLLAGTTGLTVGGPGLLGVPAWDGEAR